MLDSLWRWLWVVEIVWIGVVSVWILFERRSPTATMAWILGLSLAPVVGAPVYLFLGPRRFKRKKLRHAEAQLAAEQGAHDLDERDNRADNAVAHRLAVMCEAAAGLSARPRSAAVELYFAGVDTYAALLSAIDAARHHVHLEYYIWESDRIGTRLRDRLVACAREGIEVRVLLDGFGSAAAGRAFWRPLRKAGGRVKRFNAIGPTRRRPRLANFRTHRKIAVIDGGVGFTGGMNVCDLHSSEVSGEGAWRDTHLRLEGAAVRGLQMVFAEGWHYASHETLEGPHYYPPIDTPAEDTHQVQIVASGPDEKKDAIHKLFFTAIAGANERVRLTSPYFVPDDALMSALEVAVLRGADVQVLVPAKGDVAMVAAAMRSYFPNLLEAGVRIFEFGPPELHAKTLVVDDVLALVGTANADNRSFRLNFEVVAACYEAHTCELLCQRFEADLDRAREVTAQTVAQTGYARQLAQNLARLFVGPRRPPS